MDTALWLAPPPPKGSIDARPPPQTQVRDHTCLGEGPPKHCVFNSGRGGGKTGCEHRVLSFCIPPGQRCTIIAHQISTECYLEFTAHSSYRMFFGLSRQLIPLPWRRLANNCGS